MNKISVYVGLLFFCFVFLFSFNNIVVHAQQQCGKKCTTEADCSQGLSCMTNGVCGSYCKAAGTNCDQILDSYCDSDANIFPESRGVNFNCTCNCVDNNLIFQICSSDSECATGYLCISEGSNSGRCGKIIEDCEQCTSTTGQAGACTPSMACPTYPDNWIKTASPPCSTSTDVCCVDPQTSVGDSKDCGDVCSLSSECMNPFTCDLVNKVCNNSTLCPSCVGISGYNGVCLTDSACNGKGKNSFDGFCSNPSGTVCCTNAPTGETCSLTPNLPFYRDAFFTVSIKSSVPSISYTVTTNPTTCLAGGIITVDSSGNALYPVTCFSTGEYTITAKANGRATFCSTTVTLTSGPNPYDSCIGYFLKKPGECHLTCPLGTTWDGSNPPFANMGCGPLDSCCVYGILKESVNRKGIDSTCTNNGQQGISTAIGCVSVTNTTGLLSFILPWALGVGGGTAFILMVVAGFLIMTSAGDPGRARAGRDLLGCGYCRTFNNHLFSFHT